MSCGLFYMYMYVCLSDFIYTSVSLSHYISLFRFLFFSLSLALNLSISLSFSLMEQELVMPSSLHLSSTLTRMLSQAPHQLQVDNDKYYSLYLSFSISLSHFLSFSMSLFLSFSLPRYIYLTYFFLPFCYHDYSLRFYLSYMSGHKQLVRLVFRIMVQLKSQELNQQRKEMANWSHQKQELLMVYYSMNLNLLILQMRLYHVLGQRPTNRLKRYTVILANLNSFYQYITHSLSLYPFTTFSSSHTLQG